jgi:hypothetical protein
VSDDDLRRTLLAEAEGRLRDYEPRLREDPDQVVAYFAFGDALRAAGLARALGDESRMRAHLARAAQVAVQVFELTGTAVSSVTTLPGGDEETFVDTSATNPSTLIRALYAALASGDEGAIEALAGIDPEALPDEQVKVSDRLLGVASALTRVARGERDVGPAAARVPDDGSYWAAQLDALKRIAAGDGDVEPAIAAVAAAEPGHWRASGDEDSPEALLGLAELSLRALAARRA